MNLAEGLAKLRPTKVCDRSQVDVSEAFRQQKQEAEAFEKMVAVNLETWYPFLKDYTFASSWFPLTPALAQLLIDEYQHYLATDQERSDFSHNTELQKLQEKLDEEIQQHGDFGAFVSRSPKYSKVAIKKSKEYLLSRVKEIDEEAAKEEDPRYAHNLKQIAIFTAKLKGLRVTSGLEALQLLTTSERIHDDLVLALKNDRENSKPFDFNLIVRRWLDIPTHMEFRAFVPKDDITAFLQDWDHLYFKEFENGVFEELALKCKNFFEEKIQPILRDQMKLQSYVIDFAFVGDDIYIIELNPFGEGTGAAPFDWHNPTDRKIIYEGPFTTKRVEAPLEVTTNSTQSILDLLEVAMKA